MKRKGDKMSFSADDHTRVALEIVSQSAKISEELILKVLQSASALLGGSKKAGQNGKNSLINDKTKEGKQKINDLISKHKNGVSSLDDNVSKKQIIDYQKEFKKLGVDFSVVKNGKDNYSFFFASKDADVIEKGLKNVVQKKNHELENNIYSLKSVKKIDKQIKEEAKEQAKDKNRDQSLGR
jgi:hypothetical protein